MRFKKRYFFALLGLAVALVFPSPVSAASNITIVAAGLDSPRGIDFYGTRAVVAESGHGSNSAGDCFAPDPVGHPGFKICIGNTSQISWVNTTTGAHTVLKNGFFSISLGGQETIGVSGISVRRGKIYAQIGATSRELPPFVPTALAKEAGSLIAVNPSNGNWTSIAPVGDNDFDFTMPFTQPDPTTCGPCPGTQEHDANPTSVLATESGWLVADSGSNTLTRVSRNGKTSIVHYFPWRDPNVGFPADEVPTCVTTSEDAVWVGTLSGHLFRVHGATATEVIPKNSAGSRLLTHVTGCTAGHDGSLYLVNMFGAGGRDDATFSNGSVVKYDPESKKGSLLGDAFSNPALLLPYSPRIGPDGNLYVTAGATCAASGANPFADAPMNPCTIGDWKGGRVVRINLSQEEGDN